MCYIKAQPAPILPAGFQQSKPPEAMQAAQDEFKKQQLFQLQQATQEASMAPAFGELADLSFGSLEGSDWFNEGLADIFFSADGSSLAEPSFGGVDADDVSTYFSPLNAESSAAAVPSAAALLPWLDSLTATTAAALGSSAAPSTPAPAVPAAPAAPAALVGSVTPAPAATFGNTVMMSSTGLPSPQQSMGSSVSPSPVVRSLSHDDNASTTAAAKKTAAKRKASSPEEEDYETVLRRAKNTEAARRSRARKNARLEGLESDVARLEQDKADLLVRLAVLESELNNSSKRETALSERVAQLEGQLAESHRAMVLGMGIQPRA